MTTALTLNAAPDACSISCLLFHQRHHNGYVYATAHVHDVHGHEVLKDGPTPIDVDAGFEVAPGDANDVWVSNAYSWGCNGLVFGNTHWAYTADLLNGKPDSG